MLTGRPVEKDNDFTLPGGLNGSQVLTAQTVHNDGIWDSMSEGDGDGQDWFIRVASGGPIDEVIYADGDDVITDL